LVIASSFFFFSWYSTILWFLREIFSFMFCYKCFFLFLRDSCILN
jgi:hypothetical protein